MSLLLLFGGAGTPATPVQTRQPISAGVRAANKKYVQSEYINLQATLLAVTAPEQPPLVQFQDINVPKKRQLGESSYDTLTEEVAAAPTPPLVQFQDINVPKKRQLGESSYDTLTEEVAAPPGAPLTQFQDIYAPKKRQLGEGDANNFHQGFKATGLLTHIQYDDPRVYVDKRKKYGETYEHNPHQGYKSTGLLTHIQYDDPRVLAAKKAKVQTDYINILANLLTPVAPVTFPPGRFTDTPVWKKKKYTPTEATFLVQTTTAPTIYRRDPLVTNVLKKKPVNRAEVQPNLLTGPLSTFFPAEQPTIFNSETLTWHRKVYTQTDPLNTMGLLTSAPTVPDPVIFNDTLIVYNKRKISHKAFSFEDTLIEDYSLDPFTPINPAGDPVVYKKKVKRPVDNQPNLTGGLLATAAVAVVPFRPGDQPMILKKRRYYQQEQPVNLANTLQYTVLNIQEVVATGGLKFGGTAPQTRKALEPRPVGGPTFSGHALQTRRMQRPDATTGGLVFNGVSVVSYHGSAPEYVGSGGFTLGGHAFSSSYVAGSFDPVVVGTHRLSIDLMIGL